MEEELGELAATALGVEAAEEDVVVLALDGLPVGAEVARDADGDRVVARDEPRPVLGAPGVRLVAVPEPVLDDCGPSADRFVPRVVAVLDVLAKELADPVHVVRPPRLDVRVHPALEAGFVHFQTLSRVGGRGRPSPCPRAWLAILAAH